MAEAVANPFTPRYVSFIPTNNCWDGTFSSCYDSDGNNIHKINPDQSFHACTPALLPGGQLDGTYSFVYT